MKVIRFMTFTLLLYFIFSTEVLPQTPDPDESMIEEVRNVPQGKSQSAGDKINAAVTYGAAIPSIGTIRALVIYIRFANDTEENAEWPAGSPPLYDQPPSFMHTFIDNTVDDNSTNYSNLTNFYSQMSFDSLKLIGDEFYCKLSHDEQYYASYNYKRGDLLKEALQILDPQINFADYDNWSRAASFEHYNVPDGTVDMIFAVYRRVTITDWEEAWGDFTWHGTASLGATTDGQDYQLDGKYIKPGSGVTCKYEMRSAEYVSGVARHEFAHFLLSMSHPYANSGSGHYIWSILWDARCANTYDREKLGWITVTNITSDLENVSIPDFVTTGAAFKYHPPNGYYCVNDYANDVEYFYFENHQKLSIYDDDNTTPDDKGIFIVHQKTEYKGNGYIRCKASNGSYNWEDVAIYEPNPLMHVFQKVSVNPNPDGKCNCDALQPNNAHPQQPAGWNPQFLYVYKDENNVEHLGDFKKGGGIFCEAFNNNQYKVFSPYSNPNSKTWGKKETHFAMKITGQEGNNLIVSFYLNYWEGQLTENPTIWSGTVTVGSTVTVPAGFTLNIEPGTIVNFQNGASLTVNGTLTAIGTSANRITLNKSGTTNWGGIRFNSGSSGTVQYCNVRNATTGIKCTSTSAPVIDNNNIYNCSSYGINLYNSKSRISNNVITDNATGVYVQNAPNSPPYLYIYKNRIATNSGYGILFYSSTAYLVEPVPGTYPNPGRNRIVQNATGLRAGYSSNIFCRDGAYGGVNCLHNNTSYQVYVYYSNVNATYTWWNRPAPYFPYASDYYIQSGTLDYSNPYQGSDPNGCMLPKILVDADGHSVSESPQLDYSEGGNLNAYINDQLQPIMQLESAGQYTEALDQYVQLFRQENDKDSRRSILIQLGWCYIGSGKTDFKGFLDKEVRPGLSPKDDLYATTVELENINLIQQNNYTKAIKNFNLLKTRFADNDRVYKYALYNLGYIYYDQLGDKEKGREYFVELKEQYPNDELTWHSLALMGETDGSEFPEVTAEDRQISAAEEIPAKYALLGNYPNPFNPVTTIKYSLPYQSAVDLVIFDIMGRKINSFSISSQSVGYQDLVWNGTDAAAAGIQRSLFIQDKFKIIGK